MAEHLNNELMFHVLGYISPSVNSNLEELLGECVTEYGFSKDDCLDILQEFENRYGGYDEVIKEFRSKYYNYDAEDFEIRDELETSGYDAGDLNDMVEDLVIADGGEKEWLEAYGYDNWSEVNLSKADAINVIVGLRMKQGYTVRQGCYFCGQESCQNEETDDRSECENPDLDEGEYFWSDEGFEAPQPTINPQWAMNIIQSQYDNVGIDRVLSVREDFEGDLDITILLTNGNKQQFLIEKSMIGLIYDEDNDEYVRMEAETICESCEVNQATHRYNPIGTSLLCLDCLEEAEEEDGGNMIPKDEESLYAEEFGAEEYLKNGVPLSQDGYKIGSAMSRLTKKELIEEILGSFPYDYLLENGMVEKIDVKNAEFSPADEMALRNYIDLPPAGMGDVKGRRYRKWEHKQKGILPKQKSIGEMRRKVVDELPKGFKMAQFGLLALFGGLVYRGMTKEE